MAPPLVGIHIFMQILRIFRIDFFISISFERSSTNEQPKNRNQDACRSALGVHPFLRGNLGDLYVFERRPPLLDGLAST